MKSTLHLTTRVLPGKRIEITSPEFVEGDTVDLIIRPAGDIAVAGERRAFLKLSMAERRRILKNQAAAMAAHYHVLPACLNASSSFRRPIIPSSISSRRLR